MKKILFNYLPFKSFPDLRVWYLIRPSRTFLMVLFCIFSSAAFSQTSRFNLDLKDVSVRTVLDAVEKQGDYSFLYSEKIIDVNRIISISIKDGTIEQVTGRIFEGTKVTFTIKGRQVILTTPEADALAGSSRSQVGNVTGTVTDTLGLPILAVTVRVKGTDKGMITDANGRYSLNDVPPDAVLVFTYIGMTTTETNVSGRSVIDVIMHESREDIDEVVIIAYGTAKKRDLTGSVSSVKSSEVNLNASASIGHALKGKAAGLEISQNSAQPGGGLKFRIRGEASPGAGNEPLYIVDGVPITQLDQPGSNNERLDAGTQSILNFINPNDIASIEVLKDASATAMYGARAAHGIVLITTKRGTTGKPVVNYNTSFAMQKHANIFDVFSLKEWMEEKNVASWDMWMFENEVTPYGNRSLETAMASPKNGVNYVLPYTDDEIQNAGKGTDWVKLITRDGSIRQHNLSVTGGTEATKYMVSFNYFDQKGIIKNSELKRYTAKVNLDQDLGNYFQLGVNLTASRINSDNTPLGNQPWEKSGMLRAAVQMGPHIQAITEDGQYPINPLLPTQPNPYSLLTVEDRGSMDRVLGNINITSEPIKGLQIKLNVGTDIAYQGRNTYMPKTTLHGNLSRGIATINQTQNERYLAELTANYSKTLNEVHKISLLVGVSREKRITTGSSSGNNDFLTDAFGWYNLNAGAGTKIVGSSGGEEKWMSYFTRLNYSLLDRYLVTATFRTDGASIFAKNNKWGYFPSIAVGWNMADEQFMSFLAPTFNMFKLRASYGQTGNSNIQGRAFASYYASPAWNTPDAMPEIGVFSALLENPDLKWETTTELNIGLDLAVLKNRITGSFEFYRRIISDLLYYKPINAYHDLNHVWANMGKT